MSTKTNGVIIISEQLDQKSCIGGCPNDAFCDFGICRCHEGFEEKYGSCFIWKEDFNARYVFNNRYVERKETVIL